MIGDGVNVGVCVGQPVTVGTIVFIGALVWAGISTLACTCGLFETRPAVKKIITNNVEIKG